jgi:hypothetical protein
MLHNLNGKRLDGAIVRITDVFTPKSENSSVRRLYHHNHGYAYGIVLNVSSAAVNSTNLFLTTVK